ncbi:MAG: phospholipase A [Muribaculaceae bacterium]|nr:phospholipase A [Muribaculaceae bacterium]
MTLIVAIIMIMLASGTSVAQIVSYKNCAFNIDSIREDYNDRPYFGLYKDNYFIFGPPINKEPTSRNTNAKFQISIAQRLTRNTLPWGTYLYLFYTQKCFWNVLEHSFPMSDVNFNPGIGLGKPLFVKDRYIGEMKLMAEHESNGRAGDESRSWNKISLGANILIEPQFIVHAKGWIPIIDSKHNKDIVKYCGMYQMGISFNSRNEKWGFSALLTKRGGWNSNYNITLEANFRINKKHNQYLFLQFYNGYGEGLLEYNKFHSQLRAGIVIKPRLFSDF